MRGLPTKRQLGNLMYKNTGLSFEELYADNDIHKTVDFVLWNKDLNHFKDVDYFLMQVYCYMILNWSYLEYSAKIIRFYNIKKKRIKIKNAKIRKETNKKIEETTKKTKKKIKEPTKKPKKKTKSITKRKRKTKSITKRK